MYIFFIINRIKGMIGDKMKIFVMYWQNHDKIVTTENLVHLTYFQMRF